MRIRIANGMPLHFVRIAPEDIPQYTFPHMDDYFLSNRLRDSQRSVVKYYQPYSVNDVLAFQLQSDSGPVLFKIKKCTGQTISSTAFTKKQTDPVDGVTSIYELTKAFATTPPGEYFGVLNFAGVDMYICDPFRVISEPVNTLFFEYKNSRYYRNIIFETGWEGNIRITGLLRMKPPAAKDTVYEDQVLDTVMVQSKPYRIWELLVGAFETIPDWMIDKFNEILGCDSLKIDGKYFTKTEGAKWEETENVGYGALKTYSIELREMINRGAIDFDGEIDTDEEMSVMLNITTKGFADTSVPDNEIVQIIDVE
jgi:hypothetical protein